MFDFKKWATKAVDWSADYFDSIRDRPVRPNIAPGSVSEKLPASPPEGPEDVATIFEDFEKIILPGMTHWQHPRFFAYFPANSSPPSVVAEYLTATLSAQCMLWQTSPAATELEIVTMNWLRQAIALPGTFTGVIQDSASSATLCAILTMRERTLDWQGNTMGLGQGPVLRIYTSSHAHKQNVHVGPCSVNPLQHRHDKYIAQKVVILTWRR